MKTIIKTIIILLIIAGVVWGATYLIGSKTPQLPEKPKTSGETDSGNSETPQNDKAKEDGIKELTYDTYDAEVLGTQGKILIDFYATWCEPCKIFSPIVEEVAKEYENVKVLKVDVDKEPKLAEYFGITAMPTTVIMENGKVKSKTLGLMSKEKLIELIND